MKALGALLSCCAVLPLLPCHPGCAACAGVVLNVLFLSWLYAYYCFDYKWALEGIRLPNRLHFFECNWAYFAGRYRTARAHNSRQCWYLASLWRCGDWLSALL